MLKYLACVQFIFDKTAGLKLKPKVTTAKAVTKTLKTIWCFTCQIIAVY